MSNRRITSPALAVGTRSCSGEGDLDHDGATSIEPFDMSLADMSGTATLQETRSYRGAPGVDSATASSTTTVPPTTVRWTTPGAVVASEPLVLVASTMLPWVTGRQIAA